MSECDHCGCRHFTGSPIDDVDANCQCECHVADDWDDTDDGEEF